MLVYKIMDQNIQILNKTVVIAKFYNIDPLSYKPDSYWAAYEITYKTNSITVVPSEILNLEH